MCDPADVESEFSEELCRNSKRLSRSCESPVQSVEGRAFVAGNSEMQGVGSAQAEPVLIREARRCTEMSACHRQQHQGLGNHDAECFKSRPANFHVDAAHTQLNRKGCRELRYYPLAYGDFAVPGGGQPALGATRVAFSG